MGVAAGAGRTGTVVAGVGDGLGVWVLRGRSWPVPATTFDPKMSVETIRAQIKKIPVCLTFCSLNNGKLLYKRAGLGQQRRWLSH